MIMLASRGVRGVTVFPSWKNAGSSHLLHEIFHSAAQNPGKHDQVFCLGFVDVLLPLLILLYSTQRYTGEFCKSLLAETGLPAIKLQAGCRFGGLVEFIHFVYKLSDVHLMTGRIESLNIPDGNAACDFIKR